MLNKYILLLIVLYSVIISSCKDDDPANTPNSGFIEGQLKLFDEFGNSMASSGNVTITGTGGATASSDSNGTFILTQLQTGNYDLSFSKSGYGTFKKFNILVTSGSNGTTLNGITNIGAKSTTIISNLTSYFNTLDSTYTFGCDISPVPDTTNKRAFRLFFSKTNNPGAGNYLFTPNNAWVSTVGSGVLSGFQRQNLYSNGFSAGDSVYVIAIGESMITNTYTDPVTNKKIFPNLNIAEPSNISGFILE